MGLLGLNWSRFVRNCVVIECFLNFAAISNSPPHANILPEIRALRPTEVNTHESEHYDCFDEKRYDWIYEMDEYMMNMIDLRGVFRLVE